MLVSSETICQLQSSELVHPNVFLWLGHRNKNFQYSCFANQRKLTESVTINTYLFVKYKVISSTKLVTQVISHTKIPYQVSNNTEIYKNKN